MINPLSLAASLASWKTKLVVGAAIVASIVGLRIWDKEHQRNIGKAEVFADSKEAGAKANAKNEPIRAAAAKPGAADRLRKDSCRDC